MKVAIFVDGKNFYMGFKKHAAGRFLNFPRLATWLVEQAGGSLLVGCHYYTGIETGQTDRGVNLAGFLAMLETQRGYFVHRFPRKVESFDCAHCGAVNTFTKEKEVDTTMVADMLRMAAVDAFDALVLVSGDADHAPAVEGVRSLGKIVFVSTWGGHGLAPRIRNASFDHIDLVQGLANFEGDSGGNASTLDARLTDDARAIFLEQLRLAELKFDKGYVGLSYFLKRWRADGFSTVEAERQQTCDVLLRERKIEVYVVPDGTRALRRLMLNL